MANDQVQASNDELHDIDMELLKRAKAAAMALKNQADLCIRHNRHEQGISLYRELLMHLTRSQVKMLEEKELVLSCRMNIMGALCKLMEWQEVVFEARRVFEFMDDLKKDPLLAVSDREDAQIRGRALYFRGFAHFHLGEVQISNQDFQKATTYLPNDETITEDFKAVQRAVRIESDIKKMMSLSTAQFRANKFVAALKFCEEAMKGAKVLNRADLVGTLHGNLAAIHAKLNDYPKAIEHYREAIKVAAAQTGRTVVQEQRLYDLYDGLATAYSRNKDFKSALGVMSDSIRVLHNCPTRDKKEPLLLLNGGRLAFAVSKFDEASDFLSRAEVAALKVKQYELAIDIYTWQVKTFQQVNKIKEQHTALDKAIKVAQSHDLTEKEFYEKLLLSKIQLFEQQKTFSEDQTHSLWEMCQYFEKKKKVTSHLRACTLLVQAVMECGTKPLPSNTKMIQALSIVDRIYLSHLSGVDAQMLMRIVLVKVDMLVEEKEFEAARALLEKALSQLKREAPLVSLRTAGLRRLVELHSQDDNNSKDVAKVLEELLPFVRREKRTPENIAELSHILARLSQCKMRQGALSESIQLMEENVKLVKSQIEPSTEPKPQVMSKDEQLCEALIGLCVLEIKKGDSTRAKEIMSEIESLPTCKLWNQLDAVKGQLRGAIEANEARSAANSKPTHAVASEGPKRRWDEQIAAFVATGFAVSIFVVLLAMWAVYVMGFDLP